MKSLGLLIFSFVFLTSCTSKFLKYEKSSDLEKNDEFEKLVRIQTAKPKVQAAGATTGNSLAKINEGIVLTEDSKTSAVPKTAKKGKSKKNSKSALESVADLTKHEPEEEGQEGFIGRRPIADPFRENEKVVHEVTYLKMNAGSLTFETLPYAQVNQKKSYHFKASILSTSLFSSFYSVDDFVSILMDYETMVPSAFTLHAKETAQLREARAFYDQSGLQATYWEKKYTQAKGEEEKKLNWEILPYSQNTFSSLYYFRAFPWKVGDERAFRVTNDRENLIFTAKAIRKEVLETQAGQFNAIVIQPQVTLKGKFKPVGDIFIWLSDDDRKFILRIECKIKIGSLVSEIVKLDKGD